MLKFLTHKLRTHSINEDNYVEKVCKIKFVILTSLKVISSEKWLPPTKARNKGMHVPGPFFESGGFCVYREIF